MKLIELLEGKHDFDCELFTEEWETQYSFAWTHGQVRITEEGKKRFHKVLNSECVFTKNNIKLLDKTISYEELVAFTASVAGYVSETAYNKWFEEVMVVGKAN